MEADCSSSLTDMKTAKAPSEICTSEFASWTILDEDIGNDDFLGECAELFAVWTAPADETDSDESSCSSTEASAERSPSEICTAEFASWTLYESFPLLELPPELIFKVLEFTPIAERWRARCCRYLNEIEEGGIFNVELMTVGNKSKMAVKKRDEIQLHVDVLVNSDLSAIDGEKAVEAMLGKVARNVHPKQLTVYSVYGPEGADWLAPFSRAIRAKSLYYVDQFVDELGLESQEGDSTLEAWTDRMSVSIRAAVNFSGPALATIFTDMESGRSSLQQLQFCGSNGPTPEAARELLTMMGLTRDETGFKSTRNDLEIFQLREEGVDIDADNHEVAASMDSSENPARHLFIILGSKVKVTARKWLAGGQLVPRPYQQLIPYENELCVELFDEFASPSKFHPTFGLSIEDIRSDREKFARVPVTYLE